MCPSTPYWRGKVADLAGQMVQRRADGLYLEDIATCEALFCDDTDHAHASAGPAEWTEAVREMASAVRAAAGADRQLAADGPQETLLDLLDAFVTQHPAAERAGAITVEPGSQCTPIPLFSAVYHDYTTLIGPAVSLVNQRPHDPLWPHGVIADLRAPAHVLGGDYQVQFCLEVARAATWGCQPVLDNFLPGYARDSASRRKLAFLSAVVRASAWGVGALLPFSEFMGLLTIESAPTGADLLVNPVRSGIAERRTAHRAVQPVLGSAWRAPGGGIFLVLVNIDDRQGEFAAHLHSGRLGLQLPLRLAGQAFSEDGDVLAATLTASGSEVRGRLPARSMVLASLR
jgi:hypothetical protein